MVKSYGDLLADDEKYAERAARVGAMARDVGELLSAEDLDPIRPSKSRRIAFHSPCSLQHGQQLNGIVESLLTRLGYTLLPVKDAHLCCGSAGTYSILQPRLSQRLRERKLKALQGSGPDLIATANVGCQAHLAGAADAPVVHWIELLDRACGPAE